MTTRSEVKEQREYFLTKAYKVTVIRKGDNRISSATRFCAICKRPLSKLILTTGATVAIVSHFSCQLSDLAKVNLCADIRSCYSNIEKTAEEE